MSEQAAYTEHIYQEYHYKDFEPIHQREEIVRCKDCRLQNDIKYCERLGFEVGDYGYCAWPIRKD